jgi:hypothetical protein
LARRASAAGNRCHPRRWCHAVVGDRGRAKPAWHTHGARRPVVRDDGAEPVGAIGSLNRLDTGRPPAPARPARGGAAPSRCATAGPHSAAGWWPLSDIRPR